jgi:hypothetical protein
MKNLQAKVIIRFVAAMLVAVAITALSAVAMHTPIENKNSLALKSIQTDKTTVFYADVRPNNMWFVELVLPGSESKAATENLKLVAATL